MIRLSRMTICHDRYKWHVFCYLICMTSKTYMGIEFFSKTEDVTKMRSSDLLVITYVSLGYEALDTTKKMDNIYCRDNQAS